MDVRMALEDLKNLIKLQLTSDRKGRSSGGGGLESGVGIPVNTIQTEQILI